MSALVPTGTVLLAVLVILAQIATVALIVLLAANPKQGEDGYGVARFIGKYSVLFAFIVSLTSMLGSLFFSEIAHYEPCEFCWFQRIFMYSQVFLFGLALWRRDRGIRAYGILLSIVGGLIALNHVILQRVGTSVIPCPAVGQSVSCSKVFVVEFGYITIPAMALTGFIFIIALLLMGVRYDSEKNNAKDIVKNIAA